MINTSEDILEPLTSQVFIIGHNGWMFTDDTAGSDTIPPVKEKPEFLMVDNVSRDKIALLREVNFKFSLAESKRENGCYAMKQDGEGIQHTPRI